MGNFGYVDSTNNDHTSNQIHSARGAQAGLVQAADPTTIIIHHEMLEIPEPELPKEEEE